jgi:hypothetical protein
VGGAVTATKHVTLWCDVVGCSEWALFDSLSEWVADAHDTLPLSLARATGILVEDPVPVRPPGTVSGKQFADYPFTRALAEML